MSDVGQIRGTNFVALNRDFGDKPLGKLGGRTVETQDAPNARTGGGVNQSQTSGFKRLLDRVIDAVTPHSVRSEDKFRRGLEQTSRTTGNILGALANGDTSALRKGMGSLRSDATPVTSRGKSFDDVLTARLDVHINKLSTTELVKVAKGALQNVALPQDQAADLQKIASHVTTAARERLVEGAVADTKSSILNALATEKKPPASPTANTGYTSGAAEVHGNAIASSGLWPTGTLSDPKAGLVKAALAELQPDQRQAFLARMSHDELQALRANTDDFGRGALMGDVNFDIEVAIANARDAKRESLTIKLDYLREQLPNLKSNSVELLGLLKAMDRELSDYRKMNQDVTDIDGPLGKMLSALYDTNVESAALRKLSHAEFIEFKGLLETHAPGHLRETFRTETEARHAEIVDEVARGMENAFKLLDRGDTVGFLKAFAKNLSDQETGLQTLYTMRGKDVGGDDRQTFRQEVVDAFLGNAGLNGQKLKAFDQQLKSDNLAPIFEWLGDAGASVRQANTPVGLVALQMYSTFNTLSQEVAVRVAELTGEEPQRYDFNPRTPLSETARHGLAAMGVRVEGGNGIIAKISERVENDRMEGGRYQTDLVTMMNGEAATLNANTPVSDNFAKDVARNGRFPDRVQIDYGNGPEDLIPDENKPSDTNSSQAVVAKANQRLLALFGNDQTMVTTVTKIMHQGMIGFMGTNALRPETNPIRDENGNAVGFLGKIDERNSMSVSRDDDGSARIRLTYHTEPQFLVVNGEQIPNDKGTNGSWEVEVLVKPNGTIEVDRFTRSHNIF